MKRSRNELTTQTNVAVVAKNGPPKYTNRGWRFAGDQIMKSLTIQNPDFTGVAVTDIEDLSAIAQGDDNNQREGDTIYMVAIDLRVMEVNGVMDGVPAAAVNGYLVRWVIIRDNRGGITAPVVATLWGAANEFQKGFPMALIDNRKRYTVLLDEMVGVERYVPTFKRFYREVNYRTRYSTSDATNHTQGATWLIHGSNADIATQVYHYAFSVTTKFYSK